jgi:hypothetical protein
MFTIERFQETSWVIERAPSTPKRSSVARLT